MKILPNQIVAHDTAAQAWEYAMVLITAYGSDIITEDRKRTREIMNLQLCVLHPAEGWPIASSGWDLPALDRYAEQFLSRENPTGFAYTYGERLFAYPDSMDEIRKQDNYRVFTNFTNQIQEIIDRLKRNNNTRRAVAPLWIPWADHYNNSEVPCLQLVDFLYRDGLLHLTAFFRSHDIARAYPQNLYGLNKLLEYVAKEAGMQPGSITTISASAHIYVD